MLIYLIIAIIFLNRGDKMKVNKVKKNILMVLGMLAVLTPLAAADGSGLLTPGMGMAWYNSQSQEFKDLFVWVLGGVIFIVGAAYILFTAYGTTASHYEGTFGSQEAKSRHSNTIVRNFAILIMMIAAIMVGVQIFKWF
jgi:hypothetical protein